MIVRDGFFIIALLPNVLMASSLLAVDDNIDEFSDFESAQTLENLGDQIFEDSTKITCADTRGKTHPHNCSGEGSCHNAVNSLKGSDASSDFLANNDITRLLQDTFPCSHNDEDTQIEINDLDQHCNSHWLWKKLEDVDCIPQQQWEDSRAFQLMLHSLKIDSRNILQMCVTPIISHLETVNCELLRNILPESEFQYDMPHLEVAIPDVQFDWTFSGMTNPLEDELCLVDTAGHDVSDISTKERSVINKNSTVPQHFKEQNGDFKLKFPDLSFMQSKVLSVPFQRILSNHYGIA